MTTNYTYNQSTGNVLAKINPYSQTESYVYDTWGRLVEITDYLGKKTTTSYNKVSSSVYITSNNEEGKSSLKVVDGLGKTIRIWENNVQGSGNKEFRYDVYGRLIKESEPYSSSANQWNETTYDVYSRVTQSLSYTGQVSNVTYNGLSTTVNDGTKTVTTTKNVFGQVASVQDPGGTINYTYDAAGNMKTANYDGSVQSITYDGWGRKIQLTDPSAGTYYYSYNEFGELKQEITPKGTTTYNYDVVGKLTGKTLIGDLTNMAWAYTYNGTTKLLEQFALTNSDGNNATYTYNYDSYKRPSSLIENNLHAIFTKSFSYDGFGRLLMLALTAKDKGSNRTVSRLVQHFYQNGELLKTTDWFTGKRIYEVSSMNARGQVTSALMSNSLRQNDNYDSYGLPQNFITQKLGGTTTDLMNLGYSFNAERGLLNSRSNSVLSWNESFTYDSQNRLTNFNDNNGNNSHTYDNRGRISNNSQLGDYSYTSSSYRQIELVNPTSAAETWYQNRNLQEISYNAFKSPVEINEEGKEKISFRYNAGLQRAHMYFGDTTSSAEGRRYRRHYSEDGSMEITNDTQTGTTSFVFYLGGDAYSAPAIWKEVHTTAQITQQLYFLHRDHLGSIVLITDDAGNIAEKRQFDAWGNIVKLEDGNGNPSAAFVILDRGYTGHEHLLGVALIHMNGRLYDPKLHRFLSPDNYVQDPYNTQNFNRYGYVLNNPLSHVDPSGEFAFIPILLIIGKAALIGAGIGAAGYTASVAFSDGGFKNWDWGQFGKSAGIGAISGVATAGIGAVFGHATGTFINEVGRGLAHGLVNGGISDLTGGDFMTGFLSGELGSLAGSGFQAWGGDFAKSAVGTIGFSAVAGGIGAELTGGDFWRGAATGATVATLNHLGDKVLGNDPTKKQLEDLKSTSEAIGFTADGAEVFMGTYKGKAVYYTNMHGKMKWIPTSQVSSVISKVGKVGLYGELFTDVLGLVSGNQSGVQTATSMSWVGGTALLKLGLRGNIFSGLVYTTLFTNFAQPARPIYYRAPFGVPDNTRVRK
jgi:RHS repeat-associated protein